MLRLENANAIVKAALARAREIDAPPMTVAVLDARGCVVALNMEDGSGLMRGDIARAKAWGALGMGSGSRSFVAKAKNHPAFFTSMTAIATHGIVPVPGGVLVRNANGAIVGAVGVSGADPDRDEACCIAGIQKGGFKADAGED